MAGPRDLIAWQKAMDFAVNCYPLVRALRRGRHYELATQLLKASVSIPLNISEGQGRGTDKDFARFLDMATGSLRECETLIIFCERVGLVKRASATRLLEQSDEVGRVLFGLLRSKRR